MIEIERKYRLQDKDSVTSKLKDLGFDKQPTMHQADRIYLLNSESFDNFKPGDPVMRIRTVEDTHTLTYKRLINKEGDRIEHEMKIDPVQAAEDFLLDTGYTLVTHVDKTRDEYTLEDVTVAIDDVMHLGNFVEVEVVCEEGGEATATKQVESTAAELGLSADDLEMKKYDQLMSKLKS